MLLVVGCLASIRWARVLEHRFRLRLFVFAPLY